jgi:hypothetical protein
MLDTVVAKIVIRYVSGSKINNIDEYEIGQFNQITLGRDLASNICFDDKLDAVVSRSHAVISIAQGDKIVFAIEDLKSTNGTFLNGKLLTGRAELMPGDSVELGKGGPKFVFDLEPRPAHLTARTRVIDAASPTATRNLDAPVAASSATEPPKVGLGKTTVEGMIYRERKSVQRIWGAALSGVVAFAVIGGGALYFHNSRESAKIRAEAESQKQAASREIERSHADAIAATARHVGMTPQDIVNKFSNSTVYIEVRWQLYDRQTMRAIYQKTIGDPNSDTNLPAYVRLPNGNTVRWLMLEHENKTNLNIGESATGTGFVIDERGFLITNKHVAAGWMTELDLPRVELHKPGTAKGNAIVCNYFVRTQQKQSFRMNRDCALASTDDLDKIDDLARWNPERDGAVIFGNETPTYLSSDDRRELVGRNEVLDIRFPNERVSIAANLVRVSPEHDVSLIKVDTPQSLSKVELADESEGINQGERAMVLGYPAMSLKTFAAITTEERGNIKTRAEIIPVPTITDGIVARLGAPMQRAANVTTGGTLGDVFQLQLPSTNGNSGGPVFNASGKVIGVFTYGSGVRYQNTTFGVPIKNARALLAAQH